MDPGLELVDVLERREWCAAERVDILVPGLQGREPELLRPARVDARGRRHDRLLNRLLELLAVLRRVVEPVHLLPAERTVVGEPGVGRHLEPELEELLPEAIQHVPVLQLPFGRQPPGLLAPGPVGLHQDRPELRDRDFLAFPLHGLAAGDLSVLGAEFGILDLQRQVRLAEQRGVRLHPTQRPLEPGRLQPTLEQLRLQLLLLLRRFGVDVFEKTVESLLRVFVRCVHVFRNTEARSDLVEPVVKTGPVTKERLDRGGRQGASGQFGVVRLELRPRPAKHFGSFFGQ